MTKIRVEDALTEQAAAPAKKTVQMPVGVPGYTLADEAREVPVSEPPVWPINKDLKYVGQSVERYDGFAKVAGRARYTSDVQLPGMLYAKFVNASVPHARVLSIDTTAAEKYPGVRGVHVIQHVLGNAVLRNPALEPVKYPVVRYAGQPVAAVAATTPAAAEEAAALVKLKYDTIPFVVNEVKARDADAPKVFPGAADEEASAGGGGGPSDVKQTGNIHGPSIHKHGEIEQGFKDADVVVEGHFVTQVQTHSALETHGVVADWKPELLTVYASTQGTAGVREELSGFFKLPLTQVRVITEYMGGGFGAKFGAGNPGVVAAALSKKTGAPVRLMLDREEEHLSVGNRPSSDQTLRIGAKKDGTLTAIHLVAFGTAGCGTGAGCSGPASNLYKTASLHAEESDVFINAGPGSAMRAPGHPQGAFALEQTMDDLAVKLGMDPLDLRDKTDEHPVRRVERQVVRESELWKSRNPVANADRGPVKRGVGFAQSVWYRFVSMASNAEVRIHKDGSIEVLSGVQDIGSGIRTVMAQILAEQFGIPPAQIAVKVGDTNYTPGPESGGSVTTLSLTPAVRDAAWQASQKFLADIAPALGTPAHDLVLVDGEVRSRSGKFEPISFKRAAAKMSSSQISVQAKRVPDYDPKKYLTYGGVDVAEVEVDTELGRIHVRRVLSVHDCGRPMNPTQTISQINGGIIQGISFTLLENRLLDPVYGIMVNPDLEQYKIVGSREIPDIDVRLVEAYLGQSSTDASGIAEAAGVISIGAAIGNAVYNATGVRIRQTPMTPAVVLAALHAPAQGKEMA
ncbi:MAG TPA: xanthine dehydrogenase family protein molybdopterin-binding subunit [Acidobacteriaceae bacterium]|jgi:xanthine dehydrogenase YagR molybdenum-binding subunit|nr:xanthine dehydrogenase family protein molybdopterin-binding subunit [Acidobacteriaceae bacterium]